MSDLAAIKTELQARVGELCRRFLPNGRDEGGQWVSYNPVTGDNAHKKHGPAFKVRIRGGVPGAWIDWRSGDKGDIIDLIAYCERTDRKGAIQFAKDFLGLKELTWQERQALRKKADERQRIEAEKERRRHAARLRDAEMLWRAAGGPSSVGPALVPLGTHAYQAGPHLQVKHAAQIHAEKYFAARKIPLDQVQTLNPFSFRFSPQTEWWRGAAWKSNGSDRFKTTHGPLFPAIHSAMRNGLGAVTCCHITFLDPIMPAKAPVSEPKLMYGEAKGSVIELTTGPGGVPFWQWRPGDPTAPVIVCEGIETGLSFAIAGVPARIWACGSLAGIGSAPVDHGSVEWILFARDNNFRNQQAQDQFDKALAALEASGKPVNVQASHVGDDFNDLLTGQEA